MKTIVLVAAHKEYPMPVDPLYLPVQAGRALHAPLPYTGDDTGENISEKNKIFCELTCLYWAPLPVRPGAVWMTQYPSSL